MQGGHCLFTSPRRMPGTNELPNLLVITLYVRSVTKKYTREIQFAVQSHNLAHSE